MSIEELKNEKNKIKMCEKTKKSEDRCLVFVCAYDAALLCKLLMRKFALHL